MIASFGMALRYSFSMSTEADWLEAAIAGALDKGLRTPDLMSDGGTRVGTEEMTAAIIAGLDEAAA